MPQRDTSCSPKPYFGGLKQCPKAPFFESCYKLLILDCLGHVLRANLGAFWGASWRNTAAQLLFFGALGTHRVLLYSQVVSRSVFEASLEPFWAVSGAILYFCERAINRTRSAAMERVS